MRWIWVAPLGTNLLKKYTNEIEISLHYKPIPQEKGIQDK